MSTGHIAICPVDWRNLYITMSVVDHNVVLFFQPLVDLCDILDTNLKLDYVHLFL